MRPIQVILLGLTVLGLLLFLRLRRSPALARLSIIAGFLVAAVLIVAPDLANRLARGMGVGRGVDLVIYLSLLLMVLAFIQLYGRIRAHEERMTKLVRELAIKDVHGPEVARRESSDT